MGHFVAFSNGYRTSRSYSSEVLAAGKVLQGDVLHGDVLETADSRTCSSRKRVCRGRAIARVLLAPEPAALEATIPGAWDNRCLELLGDQKWLEPRFEQRFVQGP